MERSLLQAWILSLILFWNDDKKKTVLSLLIFSCTRPKSICTKFQNKFNMGWTNVFKIVFSFIKIKWTKFTWNLSVFFQAFKFCIFKQAVENIYCNAAVFHFSSLFFLPISLNIFSVANHFFVMYVYLLPNLGNETRTIGSDSVKNVGWYVSMVICTAPLKIPGSSTAVLNTGCTTKHSDFLWKSDNLLQSNNFSI